MNSLEHVFPFKVYFFFKILGKNHKFKNSKEILDDHITLHRDNKILGVDDHNLHYSENLSNLKKIYNQFSGSKTKLITMPLFSIDYLNFENSKVLSVGPRNEGELYFIRSLGFRWKNIYSIDLISYSSKIKLGDIHETDYPDGLFDVVICGWVIPYSNNYKKILDEIYRISKNKSILCIGYTYIPEEIDKIRKYKSSENRFIPVTYNLYGRKNLNNTELDWSKIERFLISKKVIKSLDKSAFNFKCFKIKSVAKALKPLLSKDPYFLVKKS